MALKKLYSWSKNLHQFIKNLFLLGDILTKNKNIRIPGREESTWNRIPHPVAFIVV